MTKTIDKHLIYAIGLIFLIDSFSSDNYIKPVLAMLLGLIATELSIYLEKDISLYILTGIYVSGCFIFPALTFFLPVFIYEFCYRKIWGGYGLALIYFANFKLFSNRWALFLWPLIVAISTVLALKTELLNREHKMLLELRDSSVETQTAMQLKNRELLEKQDYEIHLATLSERNRIAREIHDNVGHMLSRSILQLGALMVVHKNDPLIYQQLSSVNESLNEAMNNIRESVHDLHDESIDMKQSILEATSEIRKNYEFRLDYDMTDQVPRNVKYCFIAIVKEAMNNIVKHSNASRVSVMLREHPGFYQLLIEDNGTNIANNPNPGIGLSNMRERVESLGGTINIRTDKGFSIMVSINKGD